MNNRVVNNASWIIFCRVVQALLGLVISMITARYLGPSNFGLLNYAISVVGFVLPVMRLGINSILVQEIVSDQKGSGETLGTSLVLCLISAFVCIAGVLLFISAANPGEKDTMTVCMLYSTVLIFQSFEVFNYWFQANLMAKYSSIIALIAYVLVSAYKIYVLASGKNIYWFAVANTLDFLFIAAGLVILYKKKCQFRLVFSKERANKLLSLGKYYIVSDLMVTVFAQTDMIMLKNMVQNDAAGYYSAAIKCAAMTQFVFVAVIDSMRPTIFEAKNTSEEAYRLNLTRLFSIIVYLSLLQSVIMTAFAPLLIRILYGGEYAASVSALRIVVWYTTFSYLGSVRNIWILSEGKQKHLWKINLAGAVANVALNALLIPVLGINGAALASLLTQFFTNVITGWIFKPIRGINSIIIEGTDPRFFIKNAKQLINIVLRRGQDR